VKDGLLAKADFLASIGDREAAVKAYKETEGKTAGSSNKMDLLFSQMRCAMSVWPLLTQLYHLVHGYMLQASHALQ
jgi:hypothetical protein